MDNSSETTTLEQHPDYASFGQRFLAYTVDWGIIFVLTYLLGLLMGYDALEVVKTGTYEEMQQIQLKNASAENTASILNIIFTFFYSALFWVHYDGATPGKKLLAIKIVRENGKPITYMTAIIRYVGELISALIFLLGYVWVLWDKKKQAWHDKMASTLVIQSGGVPNIALAVLIGILVWSGALYLFATSFMKGWNSAMEEGKKSTKSISYKTQDEIEAEMDSQAKVHYERSQELFRQIREAGSDTKKVTSLNDENITELKKALEFDGDNPVIWMELGNAYTWLSSTGTLDDGLNAYKKAESLEPQNVIYSNNVGDMLIRMDRNEEAVLQLQKSLRINDNSGYAHLSIGTAYKNLGIKDKAKIHYEKAIVLYSKANDDGKFDDEILEAQKGIAALSK